MAQSYSNLSNSTILAAQDEILGVSWAEQKLGTSFSALEPADSIAGGLTLSFKLDVEAVAQTITLSAHDDPNDIAAEIQADIRLLSPIGFSDPDAFLLFTARWDSSLGKYILKSGTADSVPATAAVIVTGGTAAVPLKLGLAQDGTESKTGSEVRTYTVKYRFVFGAGKSFGSADVVVYSSQMVVPTDLSELETIANARASQMKAQLELQEYNAGDDNTLLGPVSL